MKIQARRLRYIGLIFLAALIAPLPASGADNAACLECHSPGGVESTREDHQGDLAVDPAKFRQSIHGARPCTDCHQDAQLKQGEHPTRLKPVDCGRCHAKPAEVYRQSLHGQALAKNDPYAPRCHHCHGKHDILPSSNPQSHTYVMNIPSVCSACHREGAKMMKVHDISRRDAVSQYSMSIHGKGLYQRGLIVTAVCTSCHGSHDILRHTDPRSSINHDRISKTCTKCHALIEKVHRKVIRGELWEKKPGEIPACVDCHPAHQVRRVFYDSSLPDDLCLKCHESKTLTRDNGTPAGDALFTDRAQVHASVHGKIPCIKCHVGARKSPDHRPCKDLAAVDCSTCHEGQQEDYQRSIHGKLQAQSNPNAPTCKLCHGTHGVKPRSDQASPSFPRNIPQLCGRCHRAGQPAAVLGQGPRRNPVENYLESIHGKGLLTGGLLVTATCTSCHTTHRVLPRSDPASSVAPAHIAKTCSKCHLGVYEKLKRSSHSPDITGKGPMPACDDCHQSHSISRVDQPDFRQGIQKQCARCHQEVSRTYDETFHGKASKLGTVHAAKCYDCHGAHTVMPQENPASTLSRKNIVQTCKKCHVNSNRKFTGYLTHATHQSKDKYPVLYYAFWFMTILLLGTLGFFGLHTLLWFPRSIKEMIRCRRLSKTCADRGIVYFRRFSGFHSALHLMVVISFLGLALTGLTLKFPDFSFFSVLSRWMGGYPVTGFIHRVCAVITFAYFAMHLFQLLKKWRRKELHWKNFLTGDDTLLPQKRDFIEFGQTMKWFLGLGCRPQYGRWTYWEKFDYFAVFWGVAIIGFTGLILWFPEKFTLIFPGWFINLATVIHSDEALLAVGFIFTIHFFNTHFRPDRFPMDPVIFTGLVSLEELKRDRPREYARLVEEGRIDNLSEPPPKWLVRLSYGFGLTCLVVGITLIVAIVWAVLFVY